LLSKVGIPTYQYQLNHAAGNEQGLVRHAAELKYVFRFVNAPEYTAEEVQLSKFMANAWYTMAATHTLPLPWARFNPAKHGPFLNLDVASAGGFALGSHFHAAGCELILKWVAAQPYKSYQQG
jgi:hypothetical protein